MSRNWTISPWSVMDGGISRLLNDFAATGGQPRSRTAGCVTASPAMTAWATETGYEFELDLPGAAEGDVDLEIHDGVLTLRGTWARRELPEGTETLRNERPDGEFSRTVRLPSDVDSSGVAAHLEYGVLRITLPKLPEARPRRISIAGGSLDEAELPKGEVSAGDSSADTVETP